MPARREGGCAHVARAAARLASRRRGHGPHLLSIPYCWSPSREASCGGGARAGHPRQHLQENVRLRCLGQVQDAGSACSTQIEAQEVFSIASPCAGLARGSALHVRFLAVDLWPSQEWISILSLYSLGLETQHRLLMSREDSIKLPPLIARVHKARAFNS